MLVMLSSHVVIMFDPILIFPQGDKDGNNFYLIKSGNVAVIVKAKGQVNTLKGGEFFGEGCVSYCAGHGRDTIINGKRLYLPLC